MGTFDQDQVIIRLTGSLKILNKELKIRKFRIRSYVSAEMPFFGIAWVHFLP